MILILPSGWTQHHSCSFEPLLTKLTTFGARRASTQLNTTEGSRLFITSKARKTHYKMKRNLFLIFFLAISLFFCTLCMYSPSGYNQAITLDFGELLISYTYRAWIWLTVSSTSYRERMGSAKINIFFSALVDKNERKNNFSKEGESISCLTSAKK